MKAFIIQQNHTKQDNLWMDHIKIKITFENFTSYLRLRYPSLFLVECKLLRTLCSLTYQFIEKEKLHMKSIK